MSQNQREKDQMKLLKSLKISWTPNRKGMMTSVQERRKCTMNAWKSLAVSLSCLKKEPMMQKVEGFKCLKH